MKKLDTNEFIERARKVHGDKYDYTKTTYVDSRNKICITCPEHGDFYAWPQDILKGVGCPKCGVALRAKKKTKTTEYFIEKAKQIHGDKYDYSKVEYVNAKTKVCIICPIHGEFWQKPCAHLSGKGCSLCRDDENAKRNLKDRDDFIEKAKQVHGDKYDYSKVKYIGSKKKVCIICPEHGEFWMTPNAHICCKQGCPKCSFKIFSKDSFINEAKKIHGEKYDYSEVEYERADKKVKIICPKHGVFFQTPSLHVHQKCGCPSCNESHLEAEVRNILDKNGVLYEREMMFNWLGLQRLDFYIPSLNIAIECQGIQHFTKQYFGKINENFDPLKYAVSLDIRKKELCEKNGLPLFYINYNDNVEEKINKILNI